MPSPSIQGFVQQTVNLQDTDHVRLKKNDAGQTIAARSKNKFGTKSAEWFRDDLQIKDGATKAFKAQVRQAVGNPQAQQFFAAAGIHAYKPLTRGQMVQVAQSVAQFLTPPPQDNPPPLPQAALPVQQPPVVQQPVVQQQPTASGQQLGASQAKQVAPSQQPQPGPAPSLTSFPQALQKQ